jgi:N-acetylglutamate synthase-like GNAT family acetyltransferase
MITISKAGPADIPELVALINSAYRGDGSKKGWTTEAELLRGSQRIDLETIKQHMDLPSAIFLKCVNEGQIIGTVFLEQKNKKIYLGMLSVAPNLQARGTGKQLLAAADHYAKSHHCNKLYMTVISVRHELIAWYERHGYVKTGELIPFVPEEKFGIPTQALEFAVLEKSIG